MYFAGVLKEFPKGQYSKEIQKNLLKIIDFMENFGPLSRHSIGPTAFEGILVKSCKFRCESCALAGEIVRFRKSCNFDQKGVS